jgi:AcrR family transcriptional regulator
MPKATRSAQEVGSVCDQIFNCAFDIIAEHGYESLSMSKIGKKMKMTAANLYNYYGNKDELLIAIHKKAFEMLYDKLLSALDSADTPLDRCKSLIYAYVEFGVNNINLYDIMFNRHIKQYSDYIGTPQEQMSYDEYHSSLRALYLTLDVIRDYRNSRQDLKPADPKNLAIYGISALHGIISLYNSGSLATIADDQENSMKTFIDNLIHSVID